MVHALNEIHRVLVPGGVLIDLRPFVDQSPVAVVLGNESHLAGRINQLPEDIANDEAANQAIAAAAGQNWFTLEQKEFFPFSYYWDSPEEMKAYIEEEWADFVNINDEVWQNLYSISAGVNPDYLIRIQMNLLIAKWVVVKGD